MNPDILESYGAWWVFSEGCFREMLQVLGFEIESVTWKQHMCTGRNPAGEEECMTMVARHVYNPWLTKAFCRFSSLHEPALPPPPRSNF